MFIIHIIQGDTALLIRIGRNMEPKMIADLKPADGDEALEIKVIRKWISFGAKSECCFIFIDKNGDAIQAGADLKEKGYFDSQIKVASCYRITKYICEKPIPVLMRSVPHELAIRFGKAAKFQQISNEGFPDYYFNFIGYDGLDEKVNDNEYLTDYIGRIEHVTDIIKKKGKTLRKVKLEDLSGRIIEATFWDETALSINKEEIMRLPFPIIAAVTSMRVTRYIGLQLTATSGSHIYINPKIVEAHIMTANFTNRDVDDKVLKISYDRSENTEAEKQRNRISLAELLAQDPTRHMGTQFTCRATLTRIDESRGWFKKLCNQCTKKLQLRGTTFVCEDHDEQMQPKHVYSFTANLADHTCETKVVFFDNAATSMVEKNCESMVKQLGYTDPGIIPTPLIAQTGKIKIFQLRFGKTDKQGTAENFIVDNVFEDTHEPLTTVTTTQTTTPPLTPAPLQPSKRPYPPLAKKELLPTPVAVFNKQKQPTESVQEMKKQKHQD